MKYIKTFEGVDSEKYIKEFQNNLLELSKIIFNEEKLEKLEENAKIQQGYPSELDIFSNFC